MKRIVFSIIGCFVIFFACYEFVSWHFVEKNYHKIHLENASCRIPKRMWNPEEDSVYMSSHMFSITDKEENYIIY